MCDAQSCYRAVVRPDAHSCYRPVAHTKQFCTAAWHPVSQSYGARSVTQSFLVCPCQPIKQGASLTPGFNTSHACGCILYSTDSAHRRNYSTQTRHQVVPVLSRFTVAHLSADILQEVVRHLDTRDTCALSCTCRLFHVICSEAAPLLRLSLYPHQVSSMPSRLA